MIEMTRRGGFARIFFLQFTLYFQVPERNKKLRLNIDHPNIYTSHSNPNRPSHDPHYFVSEVMSVSRWERERERERGGGGGCEKEKGPLTIDQMLQYVPMPFFVS